MGNKISLVILLAFGFSTLGDGIATSVDNGTTEPRRSVINPNCPTAKDMDTLRACLEKPSAVTAAPPPAFVKVDRSVLPDSHMVGDFKAFKASLESQLKSCSKAPNTSMSMRIKVAGKVENRLIFRKDWCVRTNSELMNIVKSVNADKSLSDEAKLKKVMNQAKDKFDWYKSDCRDPTGKGETQITGFHNPIIEGHSQRGGEFQTPLYGLPKDFVRVDVTDKNTGKPIKSACQQEQTPEGDLICPYPSRAEILDKHLAAGKELYYVKDPLDATLAQVEGSVTIKDENGHLKNLDYAGKNYQPNAMPMKIVRCMCGSEADYPTGITGIKKYFKEHKDLAEDLLRLNKSFVFFEPSEHGATGGSGQVLTKDHSLAGDTRYYPYGLLTIYNQHVQGGPAEEGIAHIQDEGGAIKGCHVDRFVGNGGEGSEADKRSGSMNDPGSVFFALPKDMWKTGAWKKSVGI